MFCVKLRMILATAGSSVNPVKLARLKPDL